MLRTQRLNSDSEDPYLPSKSIEKLSSPSEPYAPFVARHPNAFSRLTNFKSPWKRNMSHSSGRSGFCSNPACLHAKGLHNYQACRESNCRVLWKRCTVTGDCNGMYYRISQRISYLAWMASFELATIGMSHAIQFQIWEDRPSIYWMAFQPDGLMKLGGCISLSQHSRSYACSRVILLLWP